MPILTSKENTILPHSYYCRMIMISTYISGCLEVLGSKINQEREIRLEVL